MLEGALFSTMFLMSSESLNGMYACAHTCRSWNVLITDSVPPRGVLRQNSPTNPPTLPTQRVVGLDIDRCINMSIFDDSLTTCNAVWNYIYIPFTKMYS